MFTLTKVQNKIESTKTGTIIFMPKLAKTVDNTVHKSLKRLHVPIRCA